MNAPKLVLRGITKTFAGVKAVDSADLTLGAGEVHALMGANGAGKSTLMNILGGLVTQDVGEILIDGTPVTIDGPRVARTRGISFVSQELNMLPSMTVTENVLIDALPQRGGLVDGHAAHSKVTTLLKRLGCSFSPQDAVETLSMGDRQMVEIARALSSDPAILIFDEPTSSLSEREKDRLFSVIADLRHDGVAIVYITHFVDEIFAICDRVTVMRNGATVATGPIADFSVPSVVTLMLGDIHQQDRLRAEKVEPGEIVLTVTNLSRPPALSAVGFTLRAGEIVGLWGLLGSGRTEILRALVGLDPVSNGEINLRPNPGAALRSIAPVDLQAHVGFVTEDRRGEGLLLPLSVARNIAFTNLRALTNRWGLIDRKRERALAHDFVERLRIKVGSLGQAVRTLSGGNQQKVVFARWLGTAPKLFFLDEPTRGLDVGAKTDILRLTVELAEKGAAVLIASSELEELMRVCDRYLIVQRGAIVGERTGDATKDNLMAAVSDAPGSRKAAA